MRSVKTSCHLPIRRGVGTERKLCNSSRLLRFQRSASIALALGCCALSLDAADDGQHLAGRSGKETKLLEQFDKDHDGLLNPTERKLAREWLRQHRPQSTASSAPERPRSGSKLSPADVKSFPASPLYDAQVLRTFFLEFDNSDWAQELFDFHHTDVDVPARLIVDGKTYREVGVRLHGGSAGFRDAGGRKWSLHLSLDLVNDEQQVGGYRTINLLNSYDDPTFMRTVLYYQLAREFIPAPKANFARVVINGESWGLYISAQPLNKDFTRDWFRASKGVRWKVSGRGAFRYLGADAKDYKEVYELKSKDSEKAWADLIKLCRVLNETPAEQLEKALQPLLDVDATLKFLALENALVNRDGQWGRSTGYGIYQDEKGRFHFIPGSATESFRAAENFGRRGKIGGVQLDPFLGADNSQKPLLSKLLSVPSLKTRYAGYIHSIAEEWLDWQKLGPMLQKYQALVSNEVNADTHKLYSTDAFIKGIGQDAADQSFSEWRRSINLKTFIEQRRQFLLNHPAIRKAELQAQTSPNQ